MSKDWARDINEMHAFYGFHDAADEMEPEKLRAMLQFRIDFLKEELTELQDAANDGDADLVVDSLIDLIVVAIGTLDLYNVDAHYAWDEVHRANMAKKPGIKENRPNPLGLPDLIKPEGWTAPEHYDNLGMLPKAFGQKRPICEL